LEREIATQLESIVANIGSTLDEIEEGCISHEDGMFILRLSIDAIENLRNRIEVRLSDPEDLPF